VDRVQRLFQFRRRKRLVRLHDEPDRPFHQVARFDEKRCSVYRHARSFAPLHANIGRSLPSLRP